MKLAACADAYLSPVVNAYLKQFSSGLEGGYEVFLNLHSTHFIYIEPSLLCLYGQL